MRFMLTLAFNDGILKLNNKDEFINRACTEWENNFTKIHNPYVFDMIKINGKECYLDNNNYVFNDNNKIIGMFKNDEFINLDFSDHIADMKKKIEKYVK